MAPWIPQDTDPATLARLAQGPDFPEGYEPAELERQGVWKPVGNADAVVFFREKRAYYAEDGIQKEKIIKPSGERAALRYLRPVSDAWKAEHPGQIGVSRIELGALVPQGALDYAGKNERHLWVFCASDCAGAFIPWADCVSRWRFFQVAEDIWAGLYD